MQEDRNGEETMDARFQCERRADKGSYRALARLNKEKPYLMKISEFLMQVKILIMTKK